MHYLAVTPVERPGGGQGQLRSPERVNHMLSSARELYREAVARGLLDGGVLSALFRAERGYRLPVGIVEDQQMTLHGRPRHRLRVAKRGRPKTVSLEQFAGLMAACRTWRDRSIVALLGRAGLSRGEAVTLRMEDVHLAEWSQEVGCAEPGPHLHVRRREDLDGGAAKSLDPRVVPADELVVFCLDRYLLERAGVSEAAGCDRLLVNLASDYRGRGMRPDRLGVLFASLSRRAGLGDVVTPHRLRHSFPRRAVDLPRLIEAGYDPAVGVIRPPADHPVLGYELCPVAGCMAALVAGRLCYGCRQRFRRFAGSFEEFIAIPRVFALSRRSEQQLCIVCRTPGHERPAAGRSGLCLSCDPGRRLRGETVAEYAASVVPRPCYGRCARCERWAAYRSPRLCTACRSHWVSLGRPALLEFAAIPLRRSRAASRGIEVDLCELSERLRPEILCAFRHTWLDGDYVWEGTRRLQWLVDALVRVDARSLLECDSLGSHMVAALYRRLRAPVERLLGDPQRELEQDVWRLGMLRPDAGGQTIDYTAITQPWLRGLVKGWNQQRLVSHSIGLLRLDAQVGIELSRVLGLRSDGGDDPRALGCQDVVDFLVHLGARQVRGEITHAYQRNCITRLRAMLRDTRERGLHRQPGPLAGLAEQFALVDGDAPRRPARDVEGEPERALPQIVVDQLLAPEAIARLRGRAGEAVACAIELQMRTGRRPQEIAHAPFDCLEHEQRVREDGGVALLPVFVYRPEKRPKTRKELPVFAEESRPIRRMQALAVERFPGADPARLPLLPRQVRNRGGQRPLSPSMLAWKMREWVAGLEELTGPDGEPFDRKKVFPYAFRHSYAQRLADEGASESELMGLMDHDSFDTTRDTSASASARSAVAARPSLGARRCLTARGGG